MMHFFLISFSNLEKNLKFSNTHVQMGYFNTSLTHFCIICNDHI